MRLLTLIIPLFLVIVSASFANSQEVSLQEGKTLIISVDGDEKSEEILDRNEFMARNDQRMNQAYELMHRQSFQEAIDKYLNPIIADFEAANSDKNIRYYAARNQTETIMYLLGYSIDLDKGIGKKFYKKAEVTSYLWSDAYLLKGNASISLGNLAEGQKWLKKAIHLSPKNSGYLSEFAYTKTAEKKYEESLRLYEEAYAATEFSLEKSLNFDKGLALRGAGYCLIELDRLQEAEKKYLDALELNPEDQKSQAELQYIKKQRAKKFLP